MQPKKKDQQRLERAAYHLSQTGNFKFNNLLKPGRGKRNLTALRLVVAPLRDSPVNTMLKAYPKTNWLTHTRMIKVKPKLLQSTKQHKHFLPNLM